MSGTPQLEQLRFGLGTLRLCRIFRAAEARPDRVIVRSETFLTEPESAFNPRVIAPLTLHHMNPAKSFPTIAAGLERITSLVHSSSSTVDGGNGLSVRPRVHSASQLVSLML
jgi:hypothetical protein